MLKNMFFYIRKYGFKSIYARLFILFSIILSLAISIVGGYSYFMASDSIQKKVNEANLQTLMQIQKSVDKMLEGVDSITVKLATNYLLQKDFEELELPQKLDISAALFGDLKMDDYIDSIYVHYTKSGIMVTSDLNITSSRYFQDMEWFDIYQQKAPIGVMPLYINKRITKTKNILVLTVIREFPLLKMPKIGQIIINVDRDKLFRRIQGTVPGETTLLILDNEGLLMDGDEKYYNLLMQNEETEKILKDEIRYQKAIVDGKQVMISSVQSDMNGWTYIMVQNSSYLTSDAAAIKKVTIILAIICLLLGALLWLAAFSNFFNPIFALLNKTIGSVSKNEERGHNEFEFLNNTFDKVIANKNEVEELYKNSHHDIKKGLILGFCNGDYYDMDYIEKQLRAIAFPFENLDISVIVLKITDYRRWKAELDPDQISTLRKNIKIFVESFFSTETNIICSYTESDKLTCIVSYTGDENKIISLANELYSLLIEKEGISTIIGVGSRSGSLIGISLSYREATEAIRYKALAGDNAVIHSNDLDLLGTTPKYYYPLGKEEELIDEIKLGNSQNAIIIVKEVYNGIPKSRDNNSYISEILWQIMNGVFRAVNSMGVKYEDIFGKGFFESYVEYKQKEDVEEMLTFIEDQVKVIVEYINQKRKRKNDLLIKTIEEFISQNITQNISLNDVASRVYMSTSYISTIFKDNMGESFTDYLTRLRMEKAMAYLKETGHSVETVAADVGYEVRSFMRAFKKYTGMTPTEYRKDSILKNTLK